MVIVTVPNADVISDKEKLLPKIDGFIDKKLLLVLLKTFASLTTINPSPASTSLFGLALYNASLSDGFATGSI